MYIYGYTNIYIYTYIHNTYIHIYLIFNFLLGLLLLGWDIRDEFREEGT
jgi:hypothetical protein